MANEEYVNDDIDIPKGSILYTLEGCPHCDDLLDDVKKLIDVGYLKQLHCDPDGNLKEQSICNMVEDLEDFIGYPSIYTKDGKKVF